MHHSVLAKYQPRPVGGVVFQSQCVVILSLCRHHHVRCRVQPGNQLSILNQNRKFCYTEWFDIVFAATGTVTSMAVSSSEASSQSASAAASATSAAIADVQGGGDVDAAATAAANATATGVATAIARASANVTSTGLTVSRRLHEGNTNGPKLESSTPAPLD